MLTHPGRRDTDGVTQVNPSGLINPSGETLPPVRGNLIVDTHEFLGPPYSSPVRVTGDETSFIVNRQPHRERLEGKLMGIDLDQYFQFSLLIEGEQYNLEESNHIESLIYKVKLTRDLQIVE